MRDVNTLSKTWYIIENILWVIFATLIYKIHCFTNFLDFDNDTSYWILYISVCLFDAVGVLLTIKHRRNSVNTALNVLLPITIYTMFSYYRYIGTVILVLLSLGILGSVIYVVLTHSYAKTANRKFNRMRYSYLGVRAITTFCCSLIVVILLASSVSGIQLFRPDSKAEQKSISFSESLAENKKSIALLEDPSWKDLTISKKLGVLQKLCDVERSRWGLSHPINIRSRAFRNNLQGCYNNDDHTVLINTYHLINDSPTDVLDTGYHAYEYSLVQLLDSVSEEQKSLSVFDVAKTYKEEFVNYVDGESCYDDYYCQSVEADARRYTEYASKQYQGIIKEYLTSEVKEIKK